MKMQGYIGSNNVKLLTQGKSSKKKYTKNKLKHKMHVQVKPLTSYRHYRHVGKKYTLEPK